MLRSYVASHQISHGKAAQHPIVYVTRSPTAKRGVLNDDLLISQVKKLFGNNLYVSLADQFCDSIHYSKVYDGAFSPNVYTGIQGQFNLFQNAKIIFGPHGAGLTNMLWAQNGTTVIEFPLTRHVNRNMGMLAQICDHDYWLLPQISCNYFLQYTIDDAGVQALVRLLHHVIEKRGLQHLYVDNAPIEKTHLLDEF